jgi:hypothetical protein
MQLGAPEKFGKFSSKYLRIMAIRSRIKLIFTDFSCVSNAVWVPAIESQPDPEMTRNHCPLLVQLTRREPLPSGLLKTATSLAVEGSCVLMFFRATRAAFCQRDGVPRTMESRYLWYGSWFCGSVGLSLQKTHSTDGPLPSTFDPGGPPTTRPARSQ